MNYFGNASYRPRNAGHNYYEQGVYHITLVVGNRDRLLSSLNMDAKNPSVAMTEMGEFLLNQWQKTVLLQAKRGNKIRLHAQVCMPDHWHGVIEVEERMSWSLGDIIQAVKAACTSHWRKLTGYVEQPISAYRVKHMSHEERQHYYSSLPRHQRPLFDDDYDDTICFPLAIDPAEHERHKAAMINYVHDNPRRAIYRRLYPQFMQRRLHVIIDGTDYAAFGNLFLLRWAKKVQVFCHRKARYGMLTDEERTAAGYGKGQYSPDFITTFPYEKTEAFRNEAREWKQQVMNGATVIVTPGISKGEQIIKNRSIEKGYPLIHLQKEPIGCYWKPEQSRFNACVQGSLLILAPWHPEDMGEVKGVPSTTDYSIFHNLNTLAERICQFDGEARVVREE